MKQWVAWILSLYILCCAVVPCSVLDNCEEDDCMEQTTGSGQEKDCSNCPPFSICAAASGFTISSAGFSLTPSIIDTAAAYNEYYFSERAGYYSSLFQPPRIG